MNTSDLPEDENIELKEGDILNLFQSLGIQERSTLVEQFQTVVDSDSEQAVFFLEANSWNLQRAIESYYENGSSYSYFEQQTLNMKLISTTTIPSFLRPGETFRQTWRLSNSGRSSWPLRSYLIPVSGYLLKGAQPVDVPSLFPGSECEIGLSFCCPSTPGQYALSWKMWSEDNCVYFGEQIWTVVIVNEVAPAEEKREMDCENQVANLEAAFSRL